MTKRRPPMGVEDAVMQVMAILGAEPAAEIIGVTQRELRYWSDPDSDRRPIPLPWAARLDAACMAAGEAPPLYRAYRAILASVGRRQVIDPAAAMALVMVELGDVARAMTAGMSPHGAGGAALTPEEGGLILREIDETRRALALLESSVHSRIDGGAS